MMKRLVSTVAALFVSGGLALAQSNEKAAEQYFTKGNTAYNLGRFDEAVENFTKAYEAWPQPEFLYNIAQSYRLARNCKQALYFYKRFRALKDKDSSAPLSAKKREEVDKFVAELTECAAKTDTSATTQPDTLDRPLGPVTTTTTTTATTPTITKPITTTPTGTTPTTPTTATSTPTKSAQPVAALENPNDPGEDDIGVRKEAGALPKLVSARVNAGVALLSAGNLEVPMQPSFGIVGGYPLAVGPITLELGAGISYSPLPYEVMGVQHRGAMLGARLVAAAVYSVAPKILLRGDIGLGMLSLSGLDAGNPITKTREAGSFILPSVRLGVGADYLITTNLTLTVSPFGIAFSPGNAGMYADSLREIDVLIGIGYRQ